MLDSIAVSIFADILVELTTNISTNIETTVLSDIQTSVLYKSWDNHLTFKFHDWFMIYYLTFGDWHFSTHKFSFLLASFLLPVPGINTDFLGRHMNYIIKNNTGPFLFLYLGSTYSRSSNSQTNCQTQYWSSLFFWSFRKWNHQDMFLDLQTSSLVPTHVIGSKHRMSRHCFAGSSIPWTMNHFSSKLSRIPDQRGNFCLLRSIWHQMWLHQQSLIVTFHFIRPSWRQSIRK